MRTSLTRALPAVAALLAICAYQPVSGAASSSTLSVSMYCEFGHCEATASGGSGDYTWTWTNANPHSTTGPISTATPCWTYNGSTVKITATANDGSGTASASRWYTCSYSPND